MMMASPCFGQVLYNSQEISRIENLSPDMREMWLDVKLHQLEIFVKNDLEPIKKESISLIAVDTLSRIHEAIKGYKVISCSVSGGSDSDLVIDILARSTPRFKDIRFVFFDTGIEYQATKEHLNYIESKYGITIERRKAVKSIPHCCKTYGQPFLSKRVSDMIHRLQENGFQWEDEPFDVLYARYPKNKASLRWWCDNWGDKSRFSIRQNKWLKEFMVANPPMFKISSKCCDYAKKTVAKHYQKEIGADLTITGVRKAEGGARAEAYKSCMTQYDEGTDHFRPIFWFKDKDKQEYNAACDVHNSACYTEYGLKRTGCAGCPFGQRFEDELDAIEQYEPRLFNIVNNVFGESYEYTRRYKEFVREQEKKRNNNEVLCQQMP